MKTNAIVLVFGLLFMACESEPKEGEWYENIKTGERFKLSHINEASWEVELFYKMNKEYLTGKKKIDKDYLNILNGQYKLDSMRAKDKTQIYYLDGYMKMFKTSRISLFLTSGLTLKELKEDYRKIN